jgi:hypothetical protein
VRRAPAEGKWQGTVTVLHATEKALKVDYEGEEIWIPYSQVDDDSEIYKKEQVGETGELVISEWLAKEKGLIT